MGSRREGRWMYKPIARIQRTDREIAREVLMEIMRREGQYLWRITLPGSRPLGQGMNPKRHNPDMEGKVTMN
jgi:hypothetical protein